MAIRPSEIKQMKSDIEKLKKQVAQLRRRGNGKRRAIKRTSKSNASLRTANENELADEILRRAGLLAELTPEEKAMAAEWRALPEERKRKVIHELETANFNPSLSETIIQNRR